MDTIAYVDGCDQVPFPWRTTMKKAMLLLFLFIGACGNPSAKMSILDKSDCGLPCWNEIVAGQTTEDEILKILENLPDIDSQSIRNNNQTWDIFDNQITFSFRQ